MFGLPPICQNNPESPICDIYASTGVPIWSPHEIIVSGYHEPIIIGNGGGGIVNPTGGVVNPTGGIKPIPTGPILPIRVNPTKPNTTPCGCTPKANGDCGCEDHNTILDWIKEHGMLVGGLVIAGVVAYKAAKK